MMRSIPIPSPLVRRFAGSTAAALLLAGATLLPAGSVHGQSLLSSGGLGMPTGPADGRARMLGGAGVGLNGGYFSPTDPAAAGWLFLGTIEGSMEAGIESLDDGATTGRSRFPSFGIAWPLGRNVYTLGFTGVLSQEWRSQVARPVEVGDGEVVDALDRFEARSGIGAFQLGVARRLSEPLSVGVNVGRYVGSVDRNFARELDPIEVGPDVEPFTAQGRWRASGTSVTGSASWDLSSLIRVGAGATWGGDLALDPLGETAGGAVTVPMPVALRVGTHASLAPGLALVASMTSTDWSDAAAALGDDASPGRVLDWGAAVEWDGSRVRNRRIPLAVGYRSGELPFSYLGEPASESAFTGGIGIHLAEAEGIPLARVHVGLEAGTRSAGTSEESFFRTTVTFRITGR
jgi:hypothetical protein